MSAPHSVMIDELDRDEIVALLSRNHVGRIAYSMHDRVDIQPIHYVYADGWLYGRTSHGAKFATLMKNRWVAFEVDEVSALFDWTSAVVHGAVYILTPDEISPAAHHSWARAVDLLRRLVPGSLGANDPVPERDVVFRVAVQEATGRRSRVSTEA